MPTPSESITLPPASRGEVRIVFAGLMLALALAGLDQNIVSPALPRIVSELGGLAHLSWIVTAFMLTSTITTPLYGKLSDLYGRKPLFIVAIVIFVFGSALCGLAHTMTQLVLYRGLQGLGAGGLITLAQTTLADMIAPRERGRYQGLFVAVFLVCSVAGPLLGGWITQQWSWPWIFYVNVPIGAAAFLLIVLGLRRHTRPISHKIDYGGALLLTLATTCLLLALTWGGVVCPWISPTIITLAGSTCLFLGLLAPCEIWAAEPILPARLFTNRIFVVAVIGMSLTAMALGPLALLLPTYYQVVLGVTPSQSGLMIAPLMGGLIVASVVGGHLVSATGRYKIFPIIGLGTAIAAYLVLAWAALAARGGLMIGSLVVFGFGFGLVMPTLTVVIQNGVDPSDLGVATSASTFLRSLGMAVGVALSGTVMTAELYRLHPDAAAVRRGEHGGQGLDEIAQLPPDEHRAVVAAYRAAVGTTLLTGTVLTVLAFLTVLVLPERPLRSSRAPKRMETSTAVATARPTAPIPGG